MKVLDTLTLPELKLLLSQLNHYSDMTNKLWYRGAKLFQKQLLWEKTFVVEYFPAMWEDFAWEQASKIFKKSFSLTPEKSNISFIPKDSMKGGVKVYVDDSMVDVSFTKVERLMQK